MKRYGASHDDAVEAVHEAYARMHEKDLDYNEKSELHYWYVSAKNYYINTKTRQARTGELEEYHLPVVKQPSLHARFQSRRLDRLMDRLPQDEWTLLEMMRYGFKNSIIAEAFGWKDATVRTRKSELLRKLKTILT